MTHCCSVPQRNISSKEAAPFLACLHANKERKDIKHMGGDAKRLTLLYANNKYRSSVCVSVQIRLCVRQVSFIVR